jgi:hypothetical protein
MKKKLSIVFGSILGACAIHAALAACGGSDSANAQVAGSGCTQWAVIALDRLSQTDYADYMGEGPTIPRKGGGNPGVSRSMPAGWEPFAVVNEIVWLRQCMK